MLNAVLDGSLAKGKLRTDANFGGVVPEFIDGVDSGLLDPHSTWADGRAYGAQARKLVGMFIDNFAKFENHVTDDIRAAAPKAV